ncbi:MAG: cytochrome P450 [Ilumatobacteraceae bacterium]|nr:cytochrome P450 [Ilumatobacteraceae bacterium]
MTSKPDINLISPETFAASGHPWEQYAWLRKNAPVYWHDEPNGPGFWAITKYEDVRTISRLPKVFSSYETSVMLPDPDPMGLYAQRLMMLNMDPPQHDRFKLLVSRGFTPKNAPLLRPKIEELARDIVDAVLAKGECDFVSEIAGRLPSGLIAELMGMPRADGERLYDLTEIMHTNDDAIAPPEIKMNAVGEMLGYAQTVADLKRQNPGDDLATILVNAEIDGDHLTDEEFQWFFLLLVNAGGDTTRNLLAAGLQLLFDHPDQRTKLIGDLDGLLGSAVEEMLRYCSPVTHFKRTAMQDTIVGGQSIKAGERVVMFYGSANRDEDIFENADTFDVARHPNPHVAFGAGGPHLCLGMHVARVELAVMFRELLTRMPHIEAGGPIERMHSSFIAGVHRMPIKY